MVVGKAERIETMEKSLHLLVLRKLVDVYMSQHLINSYLCHRMRKRIRYAMPQKTLAELQKKLREPYSNQIEDDENEFLADKNSDTLLSYR